MLFKSIDDFLSENWDEYCQQDVDLLENLKAVGVLKKTKSGKWRMNSKNEQILKKVPELWHDLMARNTFCKDPSPRKHLMLLIQNYDSMPTCKHCGNQAPWVQSARAFGNYCNSKCSGASVEVQTKRKADAISKYGVDHWAKSAGAQDKITQTIRARYGVDRVGQLPEHVASFKNRMANNREQIREKQLRTIRARKGRSDITCPAQSNISPDALQLLRDREALYATLTSMGSLKKFCEEYSVAPITVKSYVDRHGLTISYSSKGTSAVEAACIADLEQKGIIAHRWERVGKHELDIVIPAHNVAIEVNGVRWHSEVLGSKSRSYHLTKAKLAADHGYTLMQFYAHEIDRMSSLVTSMILSKCNMLPRIYARKCTARRITARESAEFLNITHLAGSTGATCHYGLYNDDGLAMVMTFTRSRYSKKHRWEIARMASKIGITVVGGAGKLLSLFRREYSPESIITYADKRISSGRAYKSLGFEEIRHTAPNYWYFHTNDTTKLYSRQTFQKHLLASKLASFNAELSEWENMQANGYDRIWDCGNMVFEWRAT